MKPNLLTNRDAAITTHDEEHVRARAYELYEVRGRIDGHAEEDWLQAEGEVAGSNERKAVRTSTSISAMTKIVGDDDRTIAQWRTMLKPGGKP